MAVFKNIDGVFTGYIYKQDSHKNPIKCVTLKNGKGYNVSFDTGYLYRGRHFSGKLSPEQVIKKYKKQRRQQAQSRLNAYREKLNAQNIWIDADALRKVGACNPGIEAAQRKLQNIIGATVEIGAVRLSFLLQQGGEFERWGRRAAGVAHKVA